MSLPAGITPPTLVELTITPSAGQDWTFTAPTGPGTLTGVNTSVTYTNGLWVKLITACSVLTCGSTVFNRYPGMILTDGTNTLGRVEQGSSILIKANYVTTCTYIVGHNFQSNGQNFAGVSGLLNFCFSHPQIVLPPGYTIGSITPGIQATDQYGPVHAILAVWTSFPYLDAFGPMWRAR